jgi:DeoR family fructose operon transcriptional repressor
VTVLTVGGRIRGRTLATVDQWALRVLDETFVDIAFVGTNGISIERGLSTPDVAEAAVKPDEQSRAPVTRCPLGEP